MTSVCIIQEGSNGRGMSIVKVQDREVLIHAALVALKEADQRAESEGDPDLILVHTLEAKRLFWTLAGLVPELGLGAGVDTMATACAGVN